jgi:hypothetical protein
MFHCVSSEYSVVQTTFNIQYLMFNVSLCFLSVLSVFYGSKKSQNKTSV